ncbi:RNA polymerase sigma factor [Streptomyces xinghaiensis]|uniref:RNA polymerase sigma factor n=1 Tax=Streptomyces xinghaiensis TaxID=1038928 RepID=UPI0002EED01A|nr:sigma-70 family RNA polymerase sigma factor [Streptomyces xinghaiensis]MZE76793.1 sigma-70 family RNA polymerase sigma factor [Streptomyces sp. SID5475]
MNAPSEPGRLPPDFEAFFAEHQGDFLRRAQVRLRSRPDAEEAVLNAGLRMHQKWNEILSHANPMAFVHTILRGAIHDHWRRMSRRSEHESLVAHPSLPTQPTADDLANLRHYEALDRALEKLEKTAPRQAECVKLRHLVGLDYDQIAEYLDISRSAARTNTCLGRQRLKDLLEPATQTGEPA